MKKFLAFAVLICIFAGVSLAEEFEAWNLNERIHPQLKESFMKKPEINITNENIKELKKASVPSAESLPKDEAVEVHDEIINSNLRVRVYKPKNEINDMKEYPALLWIHGGGHIVGVPEMDEGLMLKITKEVNCIIAAPDYRLAPEHPYPADVEDCYAALVWMTENLPVRKDRIAVAGQSSGGGLAAAVALMARDKNYTAICFQMPLYPMLDYRNITPSSYQIRDHRASWCRDFNIDSWKWYLRDVSDDVPAYASPALAEDLSGLPPAYIMVGNLDPFRDEDIDYAKRLMQAGVHVELHVIPGGTHSFEMIFTDSELSIKAVNEYVNALAEALR